MLEGFHLQKHYGKEIIFHNFNFQFSKCGIVLLTGASGSGKTTLLHMLNLWIPFKGILRFDGIDLHRLSHQEKISFRQRFIGAVYQESGLLQSIRIQDHLTLVKAIKGNEESPILKQAWQHFFQEVSPHQLIHTLSRGQQQRLAILLACLGKTSILLLDEPTTGLDFKNRQLIYRLLRHLKTERLIVMSTHQSLDDGLPYDWHLTLPQLQSPPIALHHKKTFLPPGFQPFRFPPFWLWRYHFRYRQQQRFRKRMQALQTFTFAILGVLLSLILLVSQEILRVTETMLGGQYQWLKTPQTLNVPLQSTLDNETILQPNDYILNVRHYYDEIYFENLKPFHHFYFETNGFQVRMKDFHLGLINLYETPPIMKPPFAKITLPNDGVMLGVQTHHLTTLSQLLKCFPTLASINQVLQLSPLTIYGSIFVPDWGYQDAFTFQLHQVILTTTPQWFHPHPDYAKFVYETLLRLPSKGIEESYETQPWRVSKTMLITVKDDGNFLQIWRKDDTWQHYHLHRHAQLGWRVYRQAKMREDYQAKILMPERYDYHSPFGYHYYPEQKLSGFALPLFFYPLGEDSDLYLDTIQKLNQPYAWLDVVPPKKMAIGYVLANPGTAVKHQVIADAQTMALDEIIISKPLLDHLGLAIGDVIEVSIGQATGLQNPGVLDTFNTTSLRIVDTEAVSGNWIYHHPHWLSHWLMMHALVPSNLLMPEAWIVYQEMTPPIGFESLNPLQDVKQVVNEIENILWFTIGLFSFFIGVPMLILFMYYLLQSIEDDRMTMITLRSFGSPWSLVSQWYQIKLVLLMGEIALPILTLILGLDYLMKSWIREFFYLPFTYEFPFKTLGLFFTLIGGFFLMALWMQIRHLKKNYVLN